MIGDSVIMVLDDEPAIGKYCRAALGRAGFEVIVQQDARQAVSVIQQTRVDLLLVDIVMPYMDGFQVMQAVRARQPDIAVLFMTAYGNLETAIRALRLGADGLILKPFASTQDLVDDVERVLRDRDHRRETVRLQALRPLLLTTQSLFKETDEEKLVPQILDSIVELLSCSHAAFYRREPGSEEPGFLERVAARGDPPPGEPCSFSGGPAARAEAWGTPYYVVSDDPDEPELAAQVREQGLSAVIAAPALRGSGRNSVLLAARSLDEPVFSDADQQLFAILASQAGAALYNARLYADLVAQQQALLQAEKMAAIGRLTASIAHEVNNPLQAVRNCLHLVGRTDLAPERRSEYLALAQDELQRLMDTLRQMLDFYRPSSLQREPVDINTLVQNVLALLNKQLQEGRVKVETRLVKGLPLLYLVRNQIQQVIFNLLLNALEAMPEGGTVHIRTAKAGKKLEILVEDSGPGVAAEMRSRLFEPFVSTKPHGTGLGLSISYSIVDGHGGTIELLDGRETGAAFRITLPILEVT